ncbi:hypothetical protein [Acinetobacter puyangensis]|uniref:hypothetical protein n=1 Tax=Acinetobacter puyangensis TaxID=1096779 RepID=UPI003A4E568C
MKDEYDFSKAERGKFFKPDAQFNLPLYLEQEVHEYFAVKAQAKGVTIEQLVNEFLKKEIDVIESIV